ncbi:hypothetical protein B296_00030064 [Ensete ventricosum]|uniref:Uncharacterized protein n=1 Tax=Ensete ventricosum TaxID=4639 RepID=A0A426Y295_ENSVE|nr:hypothetical protein B296_00030064 [Ensete ventricosum]
MCTSNLELDESLGYQHMGVVGMIRALGELDCSSAYSLKGTRQVRGQGRFNYSTTATESNWEPRGMLQPKQKIEDSAKGEEIQRLSDFDEDIEEISGGEYHGQKYK